MLLLEKVLDTKAALEISPQTATNCLLTSGPQVLWHASSIPQTNKI